MAFPASRIATDPTARAAFLAALYSTGSVVGAARETGFVRATVYRQRRRDPVFAAAWDAIVGSPTVDALEAAMIARATHGVERQRHHADGSVETWFTYNDAIAWRLLERLKPLRYGRAAAAAPPPPPSPPPTMTREEMIATLAARLQRRLPPPPERGDDPPG